MFAVVTDSTAYLTKEQAINSNVTVIPMSYTIASAKFSEHYADGNADFLSAINARPAECKTSQPNATAYEAAFKRILDSNLDILVITISSRLSGSFNSAHLALNNTLDTTNQNQLQNKVLIFDSHMVAGGQKMLVDEAVRLSKLGVSINDAIIKLEQMKNNINVAFSVETMDALRRGGRIGAVKLSIGKLLNVRPILQLKEGAVIGDKTVRGEVNIIKELAVLVPKTAKKVILMCVGDTSTNKRISILKEHLIDLDAIVEYQNIGPILSIHLGDGAFGLAWI
ncbi:MAG: DegV family protein [Firmicutes bacterium]|nr:DegV family protein [Bacillota bacterium]